MIEMRYSKNGEIETYDTETGKTGGHISTMGNMLREELWEEGKWKRKAKRKKDDKRKDSVYVEPKGYFTEEMKKILIL